MPDAERLLDDTRPWRLDERAVRRAFERASGRFEQAAVLATEARRELLDRLTHFRLAPQVVLDLGAGTGRGSRELKRCYPQALVIALDLTPGMLREGLRHQRLLRRFARVCGDAQRLPLKPGTVDLIFCNLLLHWCDLGAVLDEVRRVLKPAGLVLFTTFGAATLQELRAAWAAADAGPHVHRFYDPHELGGALGMAGLAEPVLDIDRLTLRYPSVRALMRDIKAWGAQNAMAGRARALTGKGRLSAVERSYEELRQGGELPATCEVIYGVAWGAGGERSSAARGGGEVLIAPQAIARRRRPG